jgi:hypothetical protein
MDATPQQSFSGLFGFTARISRANAVPLVTVGFLGSATALLAAALIEGVHSTFSFSGASFGILVRGSDSGTHLSLSFAMLATGLITIAASSWASATMVVMLLTHVRRGRRAGVRALGCGLRYWPWVAAIVLLEDLLNRGFHLIELIWPNLLAFTVLPGLAVSLLFMTVFVFYVQEIVASRRNGLAALAESWTLVLRTGIWRVFGNRLLFAVCLLPVLLPEFVLILHFGAYSAAGGALSQFVSGVVVTPLLSAFTTVMYLLARGERKQVASVLGLSGQAEARAGLRSTAGSPPRSLF